MNLQQDKYKIHVHKISWFFFYLAVQSSIHYWKPCIYAATCNVRNHAPTLQAGSGGEEYNEEW